MNILFVFYITIITTPARRQAADNPETTNFFDLLSTELKNWILHSDVISNVITSIRNLRNFWIDFLTEDSSLYDVVSSACVPRHNKWGSPLSHHSLPNNHNRKRGRAPQHRILSFINPCYELNIIKNFVFALSNLQSGLLQIK